MDAFLALVRKDLYLYFSNKRALAITLAAPILIAAFFGSITGGAPKKPARVPVAVVDLDRSEVTRAIVAGMRADAAFDLKELAEAEAIALVRTGKARAAAVFPAGFGDRAPKVMFQPYARRPEVVLHYDPSQAMTLALVRGLLAEHVMRHVSKAAFSPESGGRMLREMRTDMQAATMDSGLREALVGMFDSIQQVQARVGSQSAALNAGVTMPFETRAQAVSGRVDRRYNGYAHSFAGMGVQFVLFMGIEIGVGLLLVRRMGLWKRLRAAPVSRRLLLGSTLASGALTAAILLAGIYAAAIAFFGVRIDGSVVGFVLVGVAFSILTAAFGLLLAAIGNTPEATRGLAILATLLLVMLGGAWVPTFIFPEWLQAATLVVPTRWAIDGLAATTWRGLGVEAVWAPVAGMLLVSAAFASIAMKRFRWEE